ncbi:Hypothetical predicted protein [Olea europaea subsp. europaea]|uniref:LOB domain-containing protein n=1 Tax=Olea europaea subsp. europaea TaxID=158383 RepID=A0A8S0RFM1_OLEEU|nr:Hypothetical predicted protein [Olea europaea subsp. europaea]
MSGSGSPCGACKFLRRKCLKDCVLAPYFCHDQGATQFAAIHKVFGASNVSKLLAHLPVSDRCEAATTMAYEAQARLQDPTYGCVSHIFALQQQVVNLQAQLASLKEQAAQCIPNSSNSSANPNDKFYGDGHSFLQDFQNWCSQSFQNQGIMSQFDPNLNNTTGDMPYFENGENTNLNPVVKYENFGFHEENISFGSMDSFQMQPNDRQ